MERTKIIIMGAAGRDFHNFNTVFRNNPGYEVVAFTATQIPDIDDRKYPASLAGKFYPKGIPIYDESKLTELIRKHQVEGVILAYSDLPYNYVMNRSAMVNAAGADFKLMGPNATMIKSTKPVISICAVRTGCGKSQTSRAVCDILLKKGKKVVAIRHPMPYGDLEAMRVQRFAEYKDLDKYQTTIEEREEYEPYLERGMVIYAGVDYEAILREAEKEADIIIWDGGNNDFSFYKPDLQIVVVDPHRPGHEISYYPGEVNARMADIVIINKCDTADKKNIQTVFDNIRAINPDAVIIKADSPSTTDKPELIRGKKVLVVEDGPTLTHGGMTFGAGFVVAKASGAKEIIDPRPYAVGTIKSTFEKYTHLDKILPAMGYGKNQIRDLEDTINRAECDVVVSGTPIDLGKLVKINKPLLRVAYNLDDTTINELTKILRKF